MCIPINNAYFLYYYFESLKSHRRINGKIKDIWPMIAGEGCGFPVCAIVDSKPKRFRSLCRLVQYMKDENLVRRVLHVQKGDCADASKWNLYVTYNQNCSSCLNSHIKVMYSEC